MPRRWWQRSRAAPIRRSRRRSRAAARGGRSASEGASIVPTSVAPLATPRAHSRAAPLVLALALPLVFLHRHYQPSVSFGAVDVYLSDLAILAVVIAGALRATPARAAARVGGRVVGTRRAGRGRDCLGGAALRLVPRGHARRDGREVARVHAARPRDGDDRANAGGRDPGRRLARALERRRDGRRPARSSSASGRGTRTHRPAAASRRFSAAHDFSALSGAAVRRRAARPRDAAPGRRPSTVSRSRPASQAVRDGARRRIRRTARDRARGDCDRRTVGARRSPAADGDRCNRRRARGGRRRDPEPGRRRRPQVRRRQSRQRWRRAERPELPAAHPARLHRRAHLPRSPAARRRLAGIVGCVRLRAVRRGRETPLRPARRSLPVARTPVGRPERLRPVTGRLRRARPARLPVRAPAAGGAGDQTGTRRSAGRRRRTDAADTRLVERVRPDRRDPGRLR